MPNQDISQDLSAGPLTQLVTMPAGGLYELATQLYPADASDPEKMAEAVHELYQLNTDLLRNEDSWTVNQQVRTPLQ